MAIPVLIYGKSGSGKSRSLKGFGKDEILHINVENKPLPFRGKFQYTLVTYDVDVMIEQMKKANDKGIKTIVIDDAGYILTAYFMFNHRQKQGNAVYEMYNNIADMFYTLIQSIKQMPDDLIVYILLHEDTNDNGDTKLKTIGRLLEDKVCIEGMVTIAIRSMSANGKHFFRVKTTGNDITKTPEDMFDTDEIENDLKAVDTAIRNYYEEE